MRAAGIMCWSILSAGIVGAATDPRIPAVSSERERASTADTISSAITREVVDTIASQIEQLYVDADTARMIAQRLRTRLASGAYAHAYDSNRLAELLSEDLRSVNHDLHLAVRLAPPPQPGAMHDAGIPAFLGREQHYALGRVDVLPGNIGYMELTGFAIDPAAESTVVAALEYLRTTDALIIDVRRNRGGGGELSNFLISHFTGPHRIPSLRVSSRAPTRVSTRYTLASVPGPRRPTVPLYVLTSRATASAGEDFAFVLQNLKRATLVGDRTAGAGHNVALVPSGHGFETSISMSRVVDPASGREWEGVGVQPDVRADPATALDVAQILALKKLEAAAPKDVRDRLAFLRETREAILHTHAISSEKLESFAGDYDGDRRVRIGNGRLLYEVPAGVPADTLVSLSDSVFATSSRARLMFVHTAQRAVELRITGPEGAEFVVKRKSSSPAAQTS